MYVGMAPCLYRKPTSFFLRGNTTISADWRGTSIYRCYSRCLGNNHSGGLTTKVFRNVFPVFSTCSHPGATTLEPIKSFQIIFGARIQTKYGGAFQSWLEPDSIIDTSLEALPSCGGVEPSSLWLWPLLAYCTGCGRWTMMSMEQSVKCLAEDTEVLGENLPLCRFVHHKSHTTWPRLGPGPSRWEAGD
jgi:hypothetical protein